MDAASKVWMFVDKVPIFTSADLSAGSVYPHPGVIACEVLREWVEENGRKRCIVDTKCPWGVAAQSGETRFNVFAEQIIMQQGLQ